MLKTINTKKHDSNEYTAHLYCLNNYYCKLDILCLSAVHCSLPHARTVVRECCKGDDESQWEMGKFDPPPPKNPLTDGHQNLCT